MTIDFNELTYLDRDAIAVLPYGTDDALEDAFAASGVTAYRFVSRQEAEAVDPVAVRAAGPLDVFLLSRFDPAGIQAVAADLNGASAKAGLRAAHEEYAWHEATGQLNDGKDGDA